jgi:hypothetical protein
MYIDGVEDKEGNELSLALRIYPRTLGITPVHNPLLSHLAIIHVMIGIIKIRHLQRTSRGNAPVVLSYTVSL